MDRSNRDPKRDSTFEFDAPRRFDFGSLNTTVDAEGDAWFDAVHHNSSLDSATARPERKDLGPLPGSNRKKSPRRARVPRELTDANAAKKRSTTPRKKRATTPKKKTPVKTSKAVPRSTRIDEASKENQEPNVLRKKSTKSPRKAHQKPPLRELVVVEKTEKPLGGGAAAVGHQIVNPEENQLSPVASLQPALKSMQNENANKKKPEPDTFARNVSSRRRRPKSKSSSESARSRSRKSEAPGPSQRSAASSSYVQEAAPASVAANIAPEISPPRRASSANVAMDKRSPEVATVSAQVAKDAATPSPVAAHSANEVPPIQTKPSAFPRTRSASGSGSSSSAAAPKASSAALAMVPIRSPDASDAKEANAPKRRSVSRRKSVSAKVATAEKRASFGETKASTKRVEKLHRPAGVSVEAKTASEEEKVEVPAIDVLANDATPPSVTEGAAAKSLKKCTPTRKKSPRRRSLSTKSPVQRRSSALAAIARGESVVDAPPDLRSDAGAGAPSASAMRGNASVVEHNATQSIPEDVSMEDAGPASTPPQSVSKNVGPMVDSPEKAPENADVSSASQSPASIVASRQSLAGAARISSQQPNKLSKRRKPAKYASMTMPAVPRLQMKKLRAQHAAREAAQEHAVDEEKTTEEELTPRTATAVRDSLFDRLAKPKLQRIVRTKKKRFQTLTRAHTSRAAAVSAAPARPRAHSHATDKAPLSARSGAAAAAGAGAAPQRKSSVGSFGRSKVSGTGGVSSSASSSSLLPRQRQRTGSMSARSSARLERSSSIGRLSGRKGTDASSKAVASARSRGRLRASSSAKRMRTGSASARGRAQPDVSVTSRRAASRARSASVPRLSAASARQRSQKASKSLKGNTSSAAASGGQAMMSSEERELRRIEAERREAVKKRRAHQAFFAKARFGDQNLAREVKHSEKAVTLPSPFEFHTTKRLEAGRQRRKTSGAASGHAADGGKHGHGHGLQRRKSAYKAPSGMKKEKAAPAPPKTFEPTVPQSPKFHKMHVRAAAKPKAADAADLTISKQQQDDFFAHIRDHNTSPNLQPAVAPGKHAPATVPHPPKLLTSARTRITTALSAKEKEDIEVETVVRPFKALPLNKKALRPRGANAVSGRRKSERETTKPEPFRLTARRQSKPKVPPAEKASASIAGSKPAAPSAASSSSSSSRVNPTRTRTTHKRTTLTRRKSKPRIVDGAKAAEVAKEVANSVASNDAQAPSAPAAGTSDRAYPVLATKASSFPSHHKVYPSLAKRTEDADEAVGRLSEQFGDIQLSGNV